MLMTIGEFHARVDSDLPDLIAALQRLTGRYGTQEAHSWDSSLRTLSHVFRRPSFDPLHLYFGSRGNLSLEYQLPASSSWCDVVLLGAHESKAAAVILELKHWQTRTDRPGRYEGLMERQGVQDLHPSDQVRGYVEYCRRFHSAVAQHAARVHGCALLTRDAWAGAYGEPPNHALVVEYPLFTTVPSDVDGRFPGFFAERLTQADEDFAQDFEQGRYRQERGFVAQIGAQILDPAANVFELLDNQRKAFALCRATLKATFDDYDVRMPRKKVVIIKGPPGSGKSVIAARLWASLVTDSNVPEGDVVFTTTSLSQSSNWSHLFAQATDVEGAGGVVRKATAYAPITTHRLGALRERFDADLFSNAVAWRESLATLRNLGEPFREGARDDQNLVSVVDEAHGLINPEHVAGRGNYGFATTLGPQAYHIIRTSLVTVFLLDPLQGFRQRENTTIEDLRKWSQELGAGDPEEISLEGMQFRCGGSTEYVSWLEQLLDGESADSCAGKAQGWHVGAGLARTRETARLLPRTAVDSSGDVAGMEFGVFDEPESWEALLRARHEEGFSARLLSTYSRKWKTQEAANPHALPANLMDFHEPYRFSGKDRRWSRIWNYVPRGNYTWYVTGHPAGRIAGDPLCEVGCPYAVRGFDYDYVGILWLNDLLWRDGRWVVDPNAVEESGMADLTRVARRETARGHVGPATEELLARVAQAYRILLTRALKGVYVWATDDETRRHLERCLPTRPMTSAEKR